MVTRWGRERKDGTFEFIVPDPPQDTPKWKINGNVPPRNWKKRKREVES